MTSTPTQPNWQQLQTDWAGSLLDALQQSGVRHVVVSPGSRSTPFLAAAAASGLECHSVIDERAAGFFGLGLARATATVPLLLCTSGTAAAHYFPAVLEAAQSELPLLLLTADRPLELMDSGAPQTLDQIKLFGDQVRGFFELGEPVSRREAVVALRSRAAQAVHRSQWPAPGPVHLNARARKPLEPCQASADVKIRRTVHYGLPRAFPDPVAVSDIAGSIASAPRGLIVAGADARGGLEIRQAAHELALRTGFPVVAEAASGLKFETAARASVTPELSRLDHFGLLLESEQVIESLAADVVIQVGRAPLARRWTDWCRRRATARAWRQVVLTLCVPSDPGHSATDVLVGSPQLTLEALVDALSAHDVQSPDSGWIQTIRDLDALAGEVVAELLATAPWSEGSIAQCVVERLAACGADRESGAVPVLSLANSLPIRLVETYAHPGRNPMRVLSQRGVNGIDGLVAGLAGFCAASEPAPTVLLIGDVALLHDVGSLQLLRSITDRPAVVVVINNDGGRIFEQLPIADPGLGQPLDLWTTPHGLGFGAAAEHAGLPYSCATTAEELGRCLDAALAGRGVTVVEAVSEAGTAMNAQRRLHSRLVERVRSSGIFG